MLGLLPICRLGTVVNEITCASGLTVTLPLKRKVAETPKKDCWIPAVARSGN